MNTKTQQPRWGEDYDRSVLRSLRHSRQEVAERVAQELNVQPRPGDRERLTEPATENAAAYDAYLRAFDRNAAEVWNRSGKRQCYRILSARHCPRPQVRFGHSALARAYTFRLFQYDPDPDGSARHSWRSRRR